jgi:hypothetical protein
MDQTEALRRAISVVRPDLPGLIGDSWPEFEDRLNQLLRQLDADPRPITRALILALFGEHPQAHKRLIAVMNTGAVQDTIKLRSPADSQTAPSPVLRYTDISCPRRVWIETPRIPVVVRLTVQRPAYSAAVQELALDPTQTVRVSLQAPGFIVLGPTVQPIAIAADADSAPVVFDLRPEKVGHTSLTFDFFQGNEPVGTAVVAVEITAYDAIEGAAPAPVRPLAFGKNVEPPDVVLHIAVEESPPSLVFSLIRDGGAWWKTFPPVRIRQLPESYAAGLYR